jgi:hypothetical protein
MRRSEWLARSLLQALLDRTQAGVRPNVEIAATTVAILEPSPHEFPKSKRANRRDRYR